MLALLARFAPSKLFVPKNCAFQHLYEPTECQSDEQWMQLVNGECKRTRSYLHDFNFLQWCDAFTGGLSSFSGVEFVCCNMTANRLPPSRPPSVAPSLPSSPPLHPLTPWTPARRRGLPVSEDDNIDYLNDEQMVTTKIIVTDKVGPPLFELSFTVQ